MSGLEVVALVAAIISAFSGTASYLKERKKRKEEKAEAKRKAMQSLELAVISAPPQIQVEYDRDFTRIGAKFASGDSIARNQLTEILIHMQQNMIQTLQGLLLSNSSNAAS
ncbi:hypothetical protein CC86DRAFT_404751 [Ophiobolus disseminans]|uniref:Uncharacterized protein n=1 Tax=Ophiobolus disseminans TaxID=1469910 RepID=A0A6A7A852_9PLEO|nr:hypothetical protein CC86DRAFT_404751 [Ophiobolus disseminans]